MERLLLLVVFAYIDMVGDIVNLKPKWRKASRQGRCNQACRCARVNIRRKKAMTTFAHISDLHFGRDVLPVIDGLIERMDNVRPDLVIISGDLTQRARANQFHAADRFLKRLSCPYLIVPGNHDLPLYNLFRRFGRPWKNWHRFVSRNMAPVVEGKGFIVVGVNTARRWAAPLDWTRGRIGAVQTRTIVNHLRTAPETDLRMLVAHHPFWLPANQARRHLIGGRDAALAILRRAGLDMILSGHVHVAYTQLLDGIIVSHAGTGTSNRYSGQANSFNVLRGDRRRLTIDVMLWDGHAFNAAESRTFVRGEDQWTSRKSP